MTITLTEDDVKTAIKNYVEGKVNTSTQEVKVTLYSAVSEIIDIEVADKPSTCHTTVVYRGGDIT